MENRHLAKMSLWLGYITTVYIHAKFEEDLLNIAVISKSILNKGGGFIKTISHSD